MRGDESPHFFGEWLKWRRQYLDLTQADLAQRAGCSVFALRKIESGERRPSKQLAALLAAALKLPPDQEENFVRAARGEISSARLPVPGREAAAPSTQPPPSPVLSPLHNWPASLTPLVGRESELGTLNRLLRDSLCRLLTLIGPGGIGKTRLAVEVAAQQHGHFADGVWFVPLAPVASPAAVVPAIADALGFTMRGQVEPRLQLFAHLADKQALLVVDNTEHLLASAALFADLLTNAPRVKILATSRERLNLQSEYVFVTQGLPVPPPDQVQRGYAYDAITLFVQSARRAGSELTLTGEELVAAVQVCRMVEGMPLGIELAAAWTPLLSCQEIAVEIQRGLDFLTTSLRDLPERQRSLRAVFDHSWRLLNPDERIALCRLAVFRGGFDRSAASGVSGASLAILLSLSSKSLIRRKEGGRYDLHELVRQYALAYLAETPDGESAHELHSRYYLAMLHRQDRALRSSAQRQTLRRLTDEIDNLRAAWTWAVRRQMFDVIEPALRCFGCLFELSGWLDEGVALLEPVIQAARSKPDIPGVRRMLGTALAEQALLFFRQGLFAQALARTGESIDLLRPFNDPELLVRPLLFQGVILQLDGRLDEAQAFTAEAWNCARATGDRWSIAYGELNLGYIDSLRGDYQSGYARMRAGVELWREVGDPRSIALGLNFMSPTTIHLGYYAQAEADLKESFGLCQEVGDRWGMGTALRYLGLAALAKDDAITAESHLRQSLKVFAGFVTGWDIARSGIYLGDAVLAQGDIDEAQACYREALSVAQEARAIPLLWEARLGLARVLALSGETTAALAFVDAALASDVILPEIREQAVQLRHELTTGQVQSKPSRP